MAALVQIGGSSLVLLVVFYALHKVTDRYFVRSLEMISARLKLTSDIAGATLMAMGSSAPELFTSLLALVKGAEFGNLGAGTIVGSAIFNILVIVGASAMFKTAVLSWQPVIRDMVFYIFSIMLLYWAFADGEVTMAEGVVFVLFYLGYLALLPVWRRIFPYADQPGIGAAEIAAEEARLHRKFRPITRWMAPVDRVFDAIMPDLERHPGQYWNVFALSILAISGLSWVLVEAGVVLARALSVPDAVIGLTVLAVGTSVPDLLSSVIVARQGKGDMAVSNAVGSNIFDILVGLGLVWIVMIGFYGQNIRIGTENLEGSVFLLLATCAALLMLLVVRRWRIGRRAGVVLILMYGVYLAVTVAEVYRGGPVSLG